MNNSSPFLAIGGVNKPRIGLMDNRKVINDEFPPSGEMTALGTVAAESGEQSLERKSALIHSGEVAKPAESVDTKHV